MALSHFSLANARERREEARQLVAPGAAPSDNHKAINPSRVTQQSNSFEIIASKL